MTRWLCVPIIGIARLGGWWRARMDERTARERAYDAAVIARISRGEWLEDKDIRR